MIIADKSKLSVIIQKAYVLQEIGDLVDPIVVWKKLQDQLFQKKSWGGVKVQRKHL